jgi:hypothetical protein
MQGVFVPRKITKSRNRLRFQCIWNSQEFLALVAGLPKPHGWVCLCASWESKLEIPDKT